MEYKLSNTDYEARQNFIHQYSATVNGISECIHCSQHAEFLTGRTYHYSTSLNYKLYHQSKTFKHFMLNASLQVIFSMTIITMHFL